MTELVDCHTHTTHSDGSSTVAQNVRRAAELGFTAICCTDHLTLPAEMDPSCEVSVPEADLPAYARDVELARASFPGVDVVFGFEADYYPGCGENIARWSRGATFVLGSVHSLDGRWIDDLGDLSYWDEMGTAYVWERYFEVWAQACLSGTGFSSMAHPDLVALLGRRPDEASRRRLYGSAAEAAREAGVRVEVNTAGLVKPVGAMYPDPELLALFSRAGVPLTVGSDAHALSRVGANIPEAYALAYRAGYRHIDVPTSAGGWRYIEL